MRILFFLLTTFTCSIAYGQEFTLSGTISNGNESLPGASVEVPSISLGTITDADGNFSLTFPSSKTYRVLIRFVGYKSASLSISPAMATDSIFVVLREDLLGLEEVVVSATRSPVPSYDAPVIVSRINTQLLETTKAASLAEGISFSPGLRIENNCQNCGFTQIRMNGLDGPYTQILINNRPMFSALMGVYGLEMIPPSMIDQIEVVRGGGSALYGGSAIAGTINILTKDPVINRLEISQQIGLTDLTTPDQLLSVNGSIVNSSSTVGLTFFANRRNRDFWDANGDSFSEITKLENTIFGFDSFFSPTSRSKLKIGVNAINEFRRGGNDFDLQPHQSDLSEQVEHEVLGMNASYELLSEDQRTTFAIYGTAQQADRKSYYGGGGRVLGPNDTLTEDDVFALNAYGNSNDIVVIGGIQWGMQVTPNFLVTSGFENNFNEVEDGMPGYNRIITQQVNTAGSYLQAELSLSSRWSILGGLRYDIISVDGNYQLGEEGFNSKDHYHVVVPRVSTMYDITDITRLRISYAQGYRAPQAFDEDLHIETVGGAALFTQLAPDLNMERSHSISSSLTFSPQWGKIQSNIVLEGFYTLLENGFFLGDQRELPSGVAVQTKRNGAGTLVRGMNIEGSFAFGPQLSVQTGATVQIARFREEEVLWEGDSGAQTTTQSVLRTPDQYGFVSLNWNTGSRWKHALTGLYTGSMRIPHVINPDNEETLIRTTPHFFDLALSTEYEFPLSENLHIDWSFSVQNILNHFQRDFDLGAERDAGYVYGPMRPRSIVFTAKVHLN